MTSPTIKCMTRECIHDGVDRICNEKDVTLVVTNLYIHRSVSKSFVIRAWYSYRCILFSNYRIKFSLALPFVVCLPVQSSSYLRSYFAPKMSQQLQDLKDLWKPWYEAQLKEIHNHKKRYLEEKPTLYPAEHFDPEEDVDALRKAMKGLGTNEDLLIDILTKRSLEQRIKIQEVYGLRHGRDLTHDLQKELTGKFEKIILSLLKPLPLFYAEQIKLAVKGAGTDETALIEIFCTRDDDFIATVKETFENQYGTPLESVITKETSGGFQKLLIALLALCRDDSGSSPDDVADELCAEDVDEDRIIRIVSSYTLYFLHRVFKKYHDKSGLDFPDLVEKVCSRESRAAYQAIFLSSKSKADFFAHAISEAIEGAGTDDTTLIRIIVSRCEIDLGSIKKKYHKLTDKDFDARVKKDVSGDYQKALLNLLGCFD